jgi:uncharacterized protein (DUF4213/DUF364 family)
MNFSTEYLELSRRLIARHPIPDVVSIHLPKLVDEPEKRDEFGFVFLADGTAAPFYTSLDDTLARLWRRFPPDQFQPSPIAGLLDWLVADELEQRALAVGAFNAMSQHLLARSGWFDQKRGTNDEKHDVMNSPGRLGMVGYFGPLIERLLARGKPVLVVENNPDRVKPQDGLTLASGPEALRDCDDILCTASTLINDSLDQILQHKRDDAYLALIGPSGSGLPDVLFRHGVDEVGGFRVTNHNALKSALAQDDSWGDSGEKYRLYRASYPGIDHLL